MRTLAKVFECWRVRCEGWRGGREGIRRWREWVGRRKEERRWRRRDEEVRERRAVRRGVRRWVEGVEVGKRLRRAEEMRVGAVKRRAEKVGRETLREWRDAAGRERRMRFKTKIGHVLGEKRRGVEDGKRRREEGMVRLAEIWDAARERMEMKIALREWGRRGKILRQRELVFEGWREWMLGERETGKERERKVGVFKDGKRRETEGRILGAWWKWSMKRRSVGRMGEIIIGKREGKLGRWAVEVWKDLKGGRERERKADEWRRGRMLDNGWESLTQAVVRKRRGLLENTRRREVGKRLRVVVGRIRVMRCFVEWGYVARERVKMRRTMVSRERGGRMVVLVVVRFWRRVEKEAFEFWRGGVEREREEEEEKVAWMRVGWGMRRWKCASLGAAERKRLLDCDALACRWWRERKVRGGEGWEERSDDRILHSTIAL